MFIVLSIYLFIYWWWSLLICWITDVTFFCFSLIYLHTTPLCTNIYILRFSIIETHLSYDSSLSVRAVKYHRALGVLFWIFATLHMLIYQVKWLQKGTLATNAWQNVRNIPRNNIDIWKYLFPLFCRKTHNCIVFTTFRFGFLFQWFYLFASHDVTSFLPSLSFSVLHLPFTYLTSPVSHISCSCFLLNQPNYWIIQGTLDAPLGRRRNDWTIPLMEFTYVQYIKYCHQYFFGTIISYSTVYVLYFYFPCN